MGNGIKSVLVQKHLKSMHMRGLQKVHEKNVYYGKPHGIPFQLLIIF